VEGVAPVPDDRERVVDDLDTPTVGHSPAPASPACLSQVHDHGASAFR
jgi:hypothetical protein